MYVKKVYDLKIKLIEISLYSDNTTYQFSTCMGSAAFESILLKYKYDNEEMPSQGNKSKD